MPSLVDTYSDSRNWYFSRTTAHHSIQFLWTAGFDFARFTSAGMNTFKSDSIFVIVFRCMYDLSNSMGSISTQIISAFLANESQL